MAALAQRWVGEADYSHCFLVPAFSAYYLWTRRKDLEGLSLVGSWWGLAFFFVAAAMRWTSWYFYYPLIDAPSLIPCLAGIALLAGGWSALRWALPGILYLIFMMPLPGAIGSLLSHPMQRVATNASTWVMQLIGVPAIARGNVIWLTTGRIGVVEACSGLRMLMVFMAMTVAAALLLKRPLWEKAFVTLSAVVIAIVSNVFRITLTAIVYEYISQNLAEKVFHDLAGLMMMPVAVSFLLLELWLLSQVLIEPAPSVPVLARR